MWYSRQLQHFKGVLAVKLVLPFIVLTFITGCATYSRVQKIMAEAERHSAVADNLVKENRYDDAEREASLTIDKAEKWYRMCLKAPDCEIAGYGRRTSIANYYVKRASLRLQMNKVELALQDTKLALRHDDVHPRARWLLGHCYVEIGDINAARRELDVLKYLDEELAGDLEFAIDKRWPTGTDVIE